MEIFTIGNGFREIFVIQKLAIWKFENQERVLQRDK
jgi:hypothetical protein